LDLQRAQNEISELKSQKRSLRAKAKIDKLQSQADIHGEISRLREILAEVRRFIEYKEVPAALKNETSDSGSIPMDKLQSQAHTQGEISRQKEIWAELCKLIEYKADPAALKNETNDTGFITIALVSE
jgi:hypothetical protein